MRLTCLSAVLLLAVVARQPPAANTEVFLATLSPGPTAAITGPLTNISNSPGYDSQPSFLADGSGVLFSSQRDGVQFDIYKYDLTSQMVTQVTHTAPENENSPLVTPDGKTFSAVQTEAPVPGETARVQRLWRFDLDGTHPRLVLENVKPVGYHVWVDATHLVLYVLGAGGQPSTLQYADTVTGTAEVMDSRIGRSLLLRPGTGTVSYISTPQGGPAMVKEFDPKTRKTRTLVETADPTSQDCAWLPDGTLLMSSGTKIYGIKLATPTRSPWSVVADFSSAGIARITRMAVGPGRTGAPRFALVAEPVAK